MMRSITTSRERIAMSINNVIKTTIKMIEGTIQVVKAVCMATVSGIIYALTHFPQVMGQALNTLWAVFKGSFEIGKFLGTLALKSLKYLIVNFPEVIKGIYEISLELLKHFPEALKFFGYTMPKFFLYTIPKEILKFVYNHFPAVAKWFFTHLPEMVANVVGVTLGIIIAPFKMAFDFVMDNMLGWNGEKRAPLPESQLRDKDLEDGLFVAAVGSVLVADAVVNDILNTEQRMQTPGYQQAKTVTATGVETVEDVGSQFEQAKTNRACR